MSLNELKTMPVFDKTRISMPVFCKTCRYLKPYKTV